MSEYQLLRAAVGAEAWVVLGLFLAASGVVFVSALRHLIDMAYGSRPDEPAARPMPDSRLGRADCRGGCRAAAGPGSLDAAAAVRGDRQRRDGSGGTRRMSFVTTRNAVPLRLADVPVLDIDLFAVRF